MRRRRHSDDLPGWTLELVYREWDESVEVLSFVREAKHSEQSVWDTNELPDGEEGANLYKRLLEAVRTIQQIRVDMLELQLKATPEDEPTADDDLSAEEEEQEAAE